jgi:histidyl-tRNA synthetase
MVGGDPLPAVGFGMGDVVLGELLAERGLVPEYRRRVDYFVVVVSDAERGRARAVAHALREKGHAVTYALREQSVGKQLKAAAKEGARHAVIVGPDELLRDCVVVRDLATGEEREVALDHLG